VKRLIGIFAVLAATLAVSIGLAPMARAGSGDSAVAPGGFPDVPTPPIFLLSQAGPPVGCSAAFMSFLPQGTVACWPKDDPGDVNGFVEGSCQTSMVDPSVGLMTCKAGSSYAIDSEQFREFQQKSVTLPAIVASNGSFSMSCDKEGCGEYCDGPIANVTPADALAGQVCPILAGFQQIGVVGNYALESGEYTPGPEARDVCNRLDALEATITAQVQKKQLSADAAALLLDGPAPSSDANFQTWGGVNAWRRFFRLGCQS
jgi:hypothetical protein